MRERNGVLVRWTTIGWAAVSAAAAAAGPGTAAAQTVRSLGSRVGATADSFSVYARVRELPDGRVLVNDPRQRQLLLYDSTFTHRTIIADPDGSRGLPDPAGLYGMMPYRGDSTLIYDGATQCTEIIGPTGAFVRVMPRPADEVAQALVLEGLGIDPAGDVFFASYGGSAFGLGTSVNGASVHVAPRGAYCASMTLPLRIGGAGSGRADTSSRVAEPVAPVDRPSLSDFQLVFTPPPLKHRPARPYDAAEGPLFHHDSTPIVRVDTVGALQTVGFIRRPARYTEVRAPGSYNPAFQDSIYAPNTVEKIDPIRFADDWALLSDGSIAIVRADDYHIDWVDPDGRRRSTPPMAFDSHVLSSDEKAAIVDSTRRYALAHLQIRMIEGTRTSHTAYAYEPDIADTSELPNYRPPFNSWALHPDRGGRLWIQESRPDRLTRAAIFDVVDRTGRIVDRVELPPDARLVGFGANDVYLSMPVPGGAPPPTGPARTPGPPTLDQLMSGPPPPPPVVFVRYRIRK